MLKKVADILCKLDSVVWMAIALGIVAAVFVAALVLSLGGDLGKFKKVAKQVAKKPDMQICNATAKQLPIRVRKQYKAMKQTGAKPDDVITPDACVYAPFKESVASCFPGAVMAAGILSILLSFFVCLGGFVKDADKNMGLLIAVPVIVTLAVMVFRLAAGLISVAILKSGVKAYNDYVNALASVLGGGAAHEHVQYASEQAAPEPTAYAQASYENTFEEPTHITVELADEEPEETVAVVEEEPVQVQPEPVIVQQPQESEEEMRARARAEAMAAAKAEQAAAQAAAAQAQAQAAAKAQAQAAAQAQAQAAAQAQPAQAAQAQPAQGASSVDEVIARIEQIKRDGASLAQMKEVALQLQKERAKPENKTPEQQRRLNEALASLLKAMSSATKK